MSSRPRGHVAPIAVPVKDPGCAPSTRAKISENSTRERLSRLRVGDDANHHLHFLAGVI